jgi:hypothetical protein
MAATGTVEVTSRTSCHAERDAEILECQSCKKKVRRNAVELDAAA